MKTKDMDESREKSRPKTSTNNGLLATKLGALLDFYSDRAVAHASFLVASVFGLVTMSAIILELEGVSVLLSIPIFYAFSYIGYYTLRRFNFYAYVSQRLAYEGLKIMETLRKVPIDEKRTLWDELNMLNSWQKKLLIPKKSSINMEKGAYTS